MFEFQIQLRKKANNQPVFVLKNTNTDFFL